MKPRAGTRALTASERTRAVMGRYAYLRHVDAHAGCDCRACVELRTRDEWLAEHAEELDWLARGESATLTTLPPWMA